MRFFLSALYDLIYEEPRGLGHFVLLLPGGMGVGAEGKSGIVMAKHEGHCFCIHAVLQGCGGKGVPEVVETDMGEALICLVLLVEVDY